MDKLKKYINNDYGKSFEKRDFSAILCALFVFSAIYGYIYEIIFYYINGGFDKVYWRGGCFGPWILIYGLGAWVIYFSCYRLRKKPWAVLLVGALGSGILEGGAGAAIYYLGNGARNWDYNTEIWNWGNIGGFVCFRSVAVFALSSLMLVYVIVPVIFFIAKKVNRRAFRIISFTLFGIYFIDQIYNSVIVKLVPSLISANEFYQSVGFSIMKF